MSEQDAEFVELMADEFDKALSQIVDAGAADPGRVIIFAMKQNSKGQKEAHCAWDPPDDDQLKEEMLALMMLMVESLTNKFFPGVLDDHDHLQPPQMNRAARRSRRPR